MVLKLIKLCERMGAPLAGVASYDRLLAVAGCIWMRNVGAAVCMPYQTMRLPD